MFRIFLTLSLIGSLVLLKTFVQNASAQQSHEYWQSIPDPHITKHVPAIEHPSYFQLDDVQLETHIMTAPLEFLSDRGIEIYLPDESNLLKRFEVFFSPVFEDALRQKFPSINSFTGHDQSDPAVKVRLTFMDNGLFICIKKKMEYFFLDPVNDNNQYVFYRGNKIHSPDRFSCYSHGGSDEPNHISFEGSGNEMKIYRIAISATGEYSEYHGGGQLDALTAIITTLNRVNMIFETELAIRFILVANNESIIFTDPLSDPFENGNLDAMLTANQTLIDTEIGDPFYDLGHVFGTSGGGKAEVGAICRPGEKAMAATGISNPIGDAFNISYVCHEIGHQLNALHTFNRCESLGTGPEGYEPGSGSTIMAYAGLCGTDNVQIASDFNFHASSLMKMAAYGSDCAESASLDNIPPVVLSTNPQNIVIPRLTPFRLTAIGMDGDGDDVYYSWEERDLGPSSPLGSPSGQAPAFRVFPPKPVPVRLFPRIETFITGSNDPTETLPNYDRSFSFWIVARDNHGALSYDTYDFEVSTQAGPFYISYPNASELWVPLSEKTILWNVNNTNINPVNCQEVDILLSSDGGYSFDILLAERVPNSGSASIEVPIVHSQEILLMVAASDNIFLDISNNYLSIDTSNQTPWFTLLPASQIVDLCGNETVDIPIDIQSIGGYDEPITLSTFQPTGIMTTLSQTIVHPQDNISLQLQVVNTSLAIGIHEVMLIGQGGVGPNDTTLIRLNLEGHLPFEIVPTPTGTTGLTQEPVLKWFSDPGVSSYLLELSTSPDFGQDVFFSSTLVDTFYQTEHLDFLSTYFWRVCGTNDCGQGPCSSTQGFHLSGQECQSIQSTDIPISISSGLPSTVDSKIVVSDSFTISHLTIPELSIFHQDISELNITLRHPDGMEVALANAFCSQEELYVGFDNNASSPIPHCPLPDGTIYQPVGDLSSFWDLPGNGTWRLRVYDNSSANGGSIERWSIDLCQNHGSATPPSIINNDTLVAKQGYSTPITESVLFATSTGLLATDVFFICESLPFWGNLLLGNKVLVKGSIWSQQEISNLVVTYEHFGANLQDDSFSFSVLDANGGRIGPFVFSIHILENILAGSVIADPDTVCAEDSTALIQFFVNSGYPPYQYSIDGLEYQQQDYFASLSPGIYTPFIRDEEGFILTLPPLEIMSFPITDLSVQINDNNIVVIPSGANDPYFFSLDNQDYVSQNTFINLSLGIHSISVIDKNNCVVTDTFIIETSAFNALDLASIVVYPSPNNGEFYVEVDEQNIDEINMCVSSVRGNRVPSIVSRQENRFFVSLLNLSPGIYLVSGRKEGDLLFIKRIVVLP